MSLSTLDMFLSTHSLDRETNKAFSGRLSLPESSRKRSNSLSAGGFGQIKETGRMTTSTVSGYRRSGSSESLL